MCPQPYAPLVHLLDNSESCSFSPGLHSAVCLYLEPQGELRSTCATSTLHPKSPESGALCSSLCPLITHPLPPSPLPPLPVKLSGPQSSGVPANWPPERKTALMVVFANFRGRTTPTTADFKPAMASLQVELGSNEQRGLRPAPPASISVAGAAGGPGHPRPQGLAGGTLTQAHPIGRSTLLS